MVSRPRKICAHLCDPDTRKKHYETASADEEEAEEARVLRQDELRKGKFLKASNMTWTEFRELFNREKISGMRPDTQDGFSYGLDLFEEVCAPPKLSSIDERMRSAFAGELRKRRGKARGATMLPSTIKAYLTYIKIALNWAVRMKIIPFRPALPPIKLPKRMPRPVPAEWFDKVLALAPDADYRLLMMFGWYAGMRLRESFLVEWEETQKAPWVDFDNNKIHFPAAFSKSWRDDMVPLDPILKEAILAHPRRGPRIVVLRNLRNGSVLTPARWRTPSVLFQRLARRAGVPMSFHTLRKGFGCRHAAKQPAQVLQRLMRHARISLTMAFYVNVDDAVMAAILGPQEKRPGNETGNKTGNEPAPRGIPGKRRRQ